MDFSRLTETLVDLNDTEVFLKEFLCLYPEYRIALVGQSGAFDSDYDRLIYRIRSKWKEKFPNKAFFLEDSFYNLKEDFFIPSGENVCIIKNLRYMPMILHSHQFIEVNYVVSSSGSLIIHSDGRIPLEDGDIILCPPGFAHCFNAQSDSSIIVDFLLRITTFDTVFFNLLNNNNYLSALFSNALYRPSKGCILWHCKEDSELQEIILLACKESQAIEKYHDKMLELLVMQFFLILMRKHEQEAIFSIPYITDSDEQFRTLLNYMQTHYQSITLPQLAMQYNYSERHIIRLLKNHSGKNFSQLLTDIRMNRAIQLLKNPSVSISRIATQLGYSSKNYFIKVFQTTFSVDPQSYRKQLEENTTAQI